MKKIHTRSKRKKRVSTIHRHEALFKDKPRKPGRKTFLTLEKAKKWMKEQTISEKDFHIVKAKKNRKFTVKKRI